MKQLERYQQAKKITVIGAAVNALLGVIKLFGGFAFHSHALVADGIHSFSDLFTDAMVIFASKYGSQDADDSHPYGHQRIETAATLILALILILAGAGIAWDSLHEIITQSSQSPEFLALPIAIFSILANEGLFHYTLHIGRQIQSDLVIANAWHHRSDAASSLVVLLGLLGSFWGILYLDAVAAVIVGLMIIKMGWSYGWNSIKELVDTAVDPALLSQIESFIQDIEGVKKVHQLRSRMMGPDVFIDVHILVDAYISVSEGHFIAQQVHHTLVKKISSVADVTVHVDPEDDEITCPSIHLPTRQMLEEQLLLKWQKAFPAILSWVIHYIDGKISMDLLCEKSIENVSMLESLIQEDLIQFNDHVERVQLFCFISRLP